MSELLISLLKMTTRLLTMFATLEHFHETLLFVVPIDIQNESDQRVKIIPDLRNSVKLGWERSISHQKWVDQG